MKKNKSSKIRVAFFADILIKDFDGASRTMFQIIERIPRDDFEYLFFCGMKPKNDIGHEVFKVPSIPIPFNKTYRIAIPLFSWFSMRRRLKKFKPDVIHIASPSPLGDFAFQFKRFRKIPVITIYHTHFLSYIHYYLRPLPFLIKPIKSTVAFGQKIFYDQSDLMYVPTQQMVDELDQFNFDKSKMKIWKRGLNHKVFNKQKKDANKLHKIVNNNKPNIIFASRLVWEKNLKTLIKIYRACEKDGSKYNFIIAGDGNAKNDLMEKMPKAIFLGKIPHDELATMYASSDIFLFPSISETYGNVVVEAMACGCPPVIAKGGGSQSLVQDGVTGFLCKPEDPHAYIDAIEKLLSDDVLRKKIIENGISFTATLDWDKLCDEYFADIKSLASKSPYSSKEN